MRSSELKYLWPGFQGTRCIPLLSFLNFDCNQGSNQSNNSVWWKATGPLLGSLTYSMREKNDRGILDIWERYTVTTCNNKGKKKNQTSETEWFPDEENVITSLSFLTNQKLFLTDRANSVPIHIPTFEHHFTTVHSIST